MPSDAVVNLVVNADGAQATVNAQLTQIVNSAERTAPAVNIAVNVDNASVVTALGEMSDRLADHLEEVNANLLLINASLGDLDRNDGLRQLTDDVDDADRSTHRLSSTFGSVASSALSAATSVGRVFLQASLASQAIPAVAALGGSLVNLVPAATAGVSAFLTMQAVSATLKLGLTGVSDALGAVFDPDADPEAVAEALERLSGNARDFVGVLQRMKPAFDDLRLDVQDRLFQGLDKALERTAKAVLPEVRKAALEYSEALNAMGRNALGSARSLGESGALGQALGSSTQAFKELERIPGQILTAIVQLAASGGPLLGRITSRIADFADSASKALSEAFESGALNDAVDDAAEAFQQLGRIVGNVFGTIGNIFSVASEQGDGLFGTLERITQAMEDFTATQEFQDALGALIETGGVLVDSILPVIEEAFRALLPVIEILAPPVQELITLIGDQLAELIPELAPVLVELAEVFGVVLEAITPLIEQGIQILIEIMPELVPLLQAVADLFVELSPLIEYFAVGANELLVPALKFAIEFFTYFVLGLAEIIDWIDQIIIAIAEFADGAIKTVLVPAVQIAVAILRGDWSTAWGVAKDATRDASTSVAQYLYDMGRTVVDQLRLMFAQSTGWFISGFNQFKSLSFAGVSYIVQQAYNLRDRFLEAIYSLASQLYNAGANMIQSLSRGILSQLGSAVSAAQEVVGAIRDFFPSSPAKRGPFSGRGYTLYSGQKLMTDFGRGIESRKGWLDVVLGRALGTGEPGSPLIPSTGLLSGASGGSSAGGISSLAGLTFGRTGPSVSVFIGNDQLSGYIQTVVDEDTAQQDRLASQGVRGN